MALQTSGPISINDIHLEVGGASSSQASLNDADFRSLINVNSGASQNIQQYYGKSSSFAQYKETVFADNTGASGGALGNRYVSFPTGVSDGDIIIAFSYDSGNVGPTAQLDISGTYVTAPNAHHVSNVANATSMWWPHTHFFSVYVQTIVCNSSTANSFYWMTNDSYGKQCQLVMVKYSTSGATYANPTGFVGGGINAIGNYNGSISPFNVITGNQTINPSQMHPTNLSNSQSVISVMVKGGDMGNSNTYATFSSLGDATGVITDNGLRPTVNFQNQAHGHSYALQYYTKQENKPSSGTYSDITVATNSSSAAGFAYYHMYFIIT